MIIAGPCWTVMGKYEATALPSISRRCFSLIMFSIDLSDGLMVCLHRAVHRSGTKSKHSLPSLSFHHQWRSQFLLGHHLLTVDRLTDGIMILSTSIHMRRWPVGQPLFNHWSTICQQLTDQPCLRGVNGVISAICVIDW